MKKRLYSLIALSFLVLSIFSQEATNQKLNLSLIFQKTQSLYWENGLGADYTSDLLFQNKLHLKAALLSSRLGSAINSNAIKQESFTLGADWHFFNSKAVQVSTGLNAGYFKADYGNPTFDALPNSSALAQFELGLHYELPIPLHLSTSLIYNFINSDGHKGPGTLFPIAYQIKLHYEF